MQTTLPLPLTLRHVNRMLNWWHISNNNQSEAESLRILSRVAAGYNKYMTRTTKTTDNDDGQTSHCNWDPQQQQQQLPIHHDADCRCCHDDDNEDVVSTHQPYEYKR
jgi:hypothetical protein